MRFSLSRLILPAICLALSACAGGSGSGPSKEQVEAMLNAELMTGDSAEAIEGFFQRHGFPFTYDASIRRYASMVGERAPLAVYVYTDTDKKMTVTLVQAPKPQQMPRPRPSSNYLLDEPGVSAPKVPR